MKKGYNHNPNYLISCVNVGSACFLSYDHKKDFIFNGGCILYSSNISKYYLWSHYMSGICMKFDLHFMSSFKNNFPGFNCITIISLSNKL